MNKQKIYYSTKYMKSFTNTVSLNKLEKLVSKTNNEEASIFAVASYVYYVKPDINKFKYKHLHKLMSDYSKQKNTKEKLNKYKQVENWLNFQIDSKELDIKIKKDNFKKINEVIKKEKITINYLSNISGVKQSNLYNYLKKEMYNSISIDNINKIWDSIKNND